MDTYGTLRAFADSWMVILMTLFFVGVIIWTFRPSARAAQEDAANIPLRNDELPDDDKESRNG